LLLSRTSNTKNIQAAKAATTTMPFENNKKQHQGIGLMEHEWRGWRKTVRKSERARCGWEGERERERETVRAGGRERERERERDKER